MPPILLKNVFYLPPGQSTGIFFKNFSPANNKLVDLGNNSRHINLWRLFYWNIFLEYFAVKN